VSSPPLGVFPGRQYADTSINLSDSGLLFLYTDGSWKSTS
jgi:hypothetical protein